jgi:hypothetical protein
MSSDERKDPIAEQLRQAREARKATDDAAEGESALIQDFQTQANASAPAEVAEIETMFIARCETINKDKDLADPEFHYDTETHELKAGEQFATYLELTQGGSPYRLDMVSGLRRDAAQVFDGFEPAYEPANWKLLAHMDERGFFWESNGERRLSSKEVVAEGLQALVENLKRRQ